MDLIFDDVWTSLLHRWQNGPRRVAVAYYSFDEGLTFDEADILIVDASDKAVMSGQTDAAALRRACLSGAKVYSHADLHAKIYVLGNQVVVGSANVSRRSRQRLREALASSSDVFAVGSAIKFITSLASASEVIDAAFLDRISSLPVISTSDSGHRRAPLDAAPSQCWYLGMAPRHYPGDVDHAEAVSTSVGERLNTEIDYFWWSPDRSRFIREVEVGDSFIEVLASHRGATDGRGVRVTGPTVIHHVDIEGTGRIRCYYSTAQRLTPMTWRPFLRLMREAGWDIDHKVTGCRAVPSIIASQLSALWPK